MGAWDLAMGEKSKKTKMTEVSEDVQRSRKSLKL